MSGPLRVILVEDNPGDALLLRETLRDAGGELAFPLTHVTRLGEALERVRSEEFDVMLLDLSLPDAHGLETLGRAHAWAPGLPIVVLTGLDDQQLALRAVQEGAQDYLVKGNVDGNVLGRALRYAIERQRMVGQLEQARAHEHHLANHDALTGLPNRQLFYDRLQQALAQAHRHGLAIAVMFLDLDHFKVINDTLGHQVGDGLLRLAAERIQGCVRESDTAARVGGDEFVLILNGTHGLQGPSIVAQHLLDRLGEPFIVDGHELHVTGSVGIALFPDDGQDVETIVRNADMAMYRAKAQGRNTYQFFKPALNDIAVERLETEKRLRLALERDEITVHYQPQVDVRTGRIVGMEALARWEDPERGMIPPARFIPLAEEIGLIDPLGDRVLWLACHQAREWQWAGLGPVRMAVNLSPQQLQRRPAGRRTQYDPVMGVKRALESTGLDADCLELEVTESVVMKDATFAIAMLNSLRETGVHIAIDDFGTGYSSLSYLKHLPAGRLKIDRSFVRLLAEDPRDEAIIEAVILMAHSLGMQVVAEGVETVSQWERLRALHCDLAQGYLFSQPVPAAEATRFLEDAKAQQDVA